MLPDLRGRIFEQPVIRVKHFFGDEEEPFPSHASIVQPLLALKLHPEAGLQQIRPLDGQNPAVRVLQDSVPSHIHLEAVRDV